MENGNKPIHPIFNDKGYPSNDRVIEHADLSGLTKREYFAAKALQGLLSIYSEGQESIVPNQDNVLYMAGLAVKAADELLCALDKIEA